MGPEGAGEIVAVLKTTGDGDVGDVSVCGFQQALRLGEPEFDQILVHIKVKPYLSCWIPLDDVHEENGTVYILPYSRAGNCELIDHAEEAGTNDMVGYHGDDPGIPVVVKAGTLVAFSSHMFHRSSGNRTDQMRRVYLLQYTPEAIYRPDGTPQNKVTPFLRDGLRINQR